MKAKPYFKIDDLIKLYTLKKQKCEAALEVIFTNSSEQKKVWESYRLIYQNIILDLEMVKKHQDMLVKAVYLDGQLDSLLAVADETKRTTVDEYLNKKFPKIKPINPNEN